MNTVCNFRRYTHVIHGGYVIYTHKLPCTVVQVDHCTNESSHGDKYGLKSSQGPAHRESNIIPREGQHPPAEKTFFS